VQDCNLALVTELHMPGGLAPLRAGSQQMVAIILCCSHEDFLPFLGDDHFILRKSPRHSKSSNSYSQMAWLLLYCFFPFCPNLLVFNYLISKFEFVFKHMICLIILNGTFTNLFWGCWVHS